MRYLRLSGQFAVIVALFAAVAAFADWPVYRQFPPGSSVVLVTFVHGASREAECRRLTPGEIAKLAPNMRRTQVCPRGRLPIYVELDLGGRKVLHKKYPPTGIAGDGPSRIYERFVVPAGTYDVVARMRDTSRPEGFDYEHQQTVKLVPDQMFVVDFRSERGEFVFH